MNSIRQPVIQSNWWRLITFFIIFLAITVFLFIPIFLLFPEALVYSQNSETNFDESLPFLFLNQAVVISGIFITLYIFSRHIEFKSVADYRLSINVKELFYGFCIGAVLILAFVLVLLIGWDTRISFQGISLQLALSLLLYLLVAVSEEVLVRSYILSNLKERMNSFFALTLSSILFAAMHLANDHLTAIGLLTIALSGLLFGVLTLNTNSISAAVGMHWSWNFLQGPIFGLGVSGLNQQGLFRIDTNATSLFSGGLFGAEGSIIMVIISVLSIALIYFFYPEKVRS